jgi:hypothetical protein
LRKQAALPCVNILQGKINKSILKAGIQHREDNKTIQQEFMYLSKPCFSAA